MKQPVKGLVLIILISVLFSITQDNVASTKTEQPRITGIVTDTNGVPLTGVEVTARCRTMGDNFYRLVCPNTWTDENGLFSLPVDFPDLKYSVTFQYRRHSLHQMEIVPSETGELKISLERKASHVITGQVVHHAFLFPIPDAIVKYFGEYQKFIIETKTDDKGRFEITELPSSEFQGVIYAQQYEMVSPVTMVRYRDNEQSTDLQLKLGSGGELWGIVTAEGTDKPIENCTVSITTDYMSGYSKQTTTNAKGLYRFRDLPPAVYVITAQSSDYFTFVKRNASNENRISIDIGQRYRNDLNLKKMVTFEGKVVDHKGKTVAGAIVAIDEAHVSDNKYSPFVVHTDQKGRFSIKTGRIETEIPKKASGFKAIEQWLDGIFNKRIGEDAIETFCSTAGYGRINFSPYKEGKVIKGVTIKLCGMISVRGKVTDPKGNPIENVRIIDTTGFEIWTETDSEGEFDLGRIPIRWPGRKLGTISFLAPRPDGAQVINSRAMIIKDVTSYAAGTGFVHHRQCQYNIEPDEDIELSVVLEPTELITLKGTVVCDNNSPAAGAAVSLFAGNAGQNTWLRTLHPNPSGDYIRDSVIYKTKADEKGQWKIIMARETAEGMKLAFWAKNDPTLFSLGVEGPNGQTALIRDIVINNKTAEKKIDVVIKPSKNPSTFDTDNRR